VLWSQFFNFLHFQTLFCFQREKKTMWYLCVFYHRLLDYRKPEVESLAQLFGAIEDPQNDDVPFQLQWKLPPHYHTDSPFHFVNLPSEQLAHNIATRSQLLPLNGFSFCFMGLFKVSIFNPFLLGGDSAGILVKGMYELWGEGSSYEELKESVLSYPDERKLPYLDSDSTFKITVDCFGKVISLGEQKELIQGLSYIPFKVRGVFF